MRQGPWRAQVISMRTRWVLVAFGLAIAPLALAQDGPSAPTLEAIEARLSAIEEQPDAEVAARAIEHGRLAIARARVRTSAQEAPSAERARQIAWAALALAGRQVERAREAAALAAAERRLAEAEARARRARGVLEGAIEHRAAAAAGETGASAGGPPEEPEGEE